MDRRQWLGGIAAVGAIGGFGCLPASAAKTGTGAAGLPVVQVFKDPNCGCCNAWVQHLEKAGFTVQVSEVNDIGAVRQRLGMPAQYGSCHSATVAGYVIEGHVPAAEIRQLLATRPAALGLAVPGMPVGSPGMEMGPRADPYAVLLISRQGAASVFARYPKKA